MPSPSNLSSTRLAVLGALASLLAAQRPAHAQSVPGFTVTTYASVPDPVLLSFGPDGSLYVGRDAVASGSSTPNFVHKVGPGGSPVTALGNAAIGDPDTILLDVAGTISGLPGTLLVTGLLGSTSTGRFSGIRPDGTVFTLFDAGTWANVVEMKFDHSGRLVFTAVESRSIWTSTGGTPTILATLPGSAYPTYLTIAPDNRIVVGASDNVLRVYEPNGTLANGSLATLQGLAGLEYAPGGSFGTDLYALDSAAGTLVRINAAGSKTVAGTGFGTGFATKDIAFGPGGDLFVSVNTSDKVLRIAGTWKDLGFGLAGAAGVPVLSPLGSATAGGMTNFVVSQALPSSFGALVLGVSRIDLPLFGGVLVPNLDLLQSITTSPAGTANLSFPWPPALPVGVPIYAQAWILDNAAPEGLSASNGFGTTTG